MPLCSGELARMLEVIGLLVFWCPLSVGPQCWKGGVKEQKQQHHGRGGPVACPSYGCIQDLAGFLSCSHHLELGCAHSRYSRKDFGFE